MKKVNTNRHLFNVTDGRGCRVTGCNFIQMIGQWCRNIKNGHGTKDIFHYRGYPS